MALVGPGSLEILIQLFFPLLIRHPPNARHCATRFVRVGPELQSLWV